MDLSISVHLGNKLSKLRPRSRIDLDNIGNLVSHFPSSSSSEDSISATPCWMVHDGAETSTEDKLGLARVLVQSVHVLEVSSVSGLESPLSPRRRRSWQLAPLMELEPELSVHDVFNGSIARSLFLTSSSISLSPIHKFSLAARFSASRRPHQSLQHVDQQDILMRQNSTVPSTHGSRQYREEMSTAIRLRRFFHGVRRLTLNPWRLFRMVQNTVLTCRSRNHSGRSDRNQKYVNDSSPGTVRP
ncbi:hypothetical protein YC2023_078520 [Brassica napus]